MCITAEIYKNGGPAHSEVHRQRINLEAGDHYQLIESGRQEFHPTSRQRIRPLHRSATPRPRKLLDAPPVDTLKGLRESRYPQGGDLHILLTAGCGEAPRCDDNPAGGVRRPDRLHRPRRGVGGGRQPRAVRVCARPFRLGAAARRPNGRSRYSPRSVSMGSTAAARHAGM